MTRHQHYAIGETQAIQALQMRHQGHRLPVWLWAVPMGRPTESEACICFKNDSKCLCISAFNVRRIICVSPQYATHCRAIILPAAFHEYQLSGAYHALQASSFVTAAVTECRTLT